MALPDVGSQSFEFYEGIRILIPGLFGAGIGAAAYETLNIQGESNLLSSAAVGILVVFGIGFTLYLIDIPARSALYRQHFPSDFLRERFGSAGLRDAVNAWFLVMDEAMPANIRARALYMGSIYRIGFEAILLLTVAQFALWIWVSWRDGGGLTSDRDYFWPLFISLNSSLAWPLAVDIQRSYRRLRTSAGPLRSIACSLPMGVERSGIQLLTDLTWFKLAVFLAATATLFSVMHSWPAEPPHVIGVISLVVLAAVWLHTFMFGRVEKNARIAPHRLTSLTLLVVSMSCTFLFARRTGLREAVSSPDLLQAWMAVAVLTCLLVFAGGHERKLRGAYSSQRSWFDLNEERIRKVLHLPDGPAESEGEESSG